MEAPVKKMPSGQPWTVLVAALLSTRTKDEVTTKAVKRVLAQAPDPEHLLKMNEREVAELIYPVGFYRTKARFLIRLARIIVEKGQGQVPQNRAALLSLPGVGAKVANVVMAEGFGVPAIAVDTHVHRITNRLGLVSTKIPEQTEISLKKILPRRYWRDWNRLLVALGQTICLPRSPRCGLCPVERLCSKRGIRIARGGIG
jgi:endonuclease-3